MFDTFTFRRDFRAACTAVSLVVSLVLAPVAAPIGHAATPRTRTNAETQTRIRTPKASTVTRGEFIQRAVKALHVKNAAASRTMRAAIQAAESRKALTVFSGKPDWNKPITRGEALSVIVTLTGIQKTDAVFLDDLRTTAQQQVAAAAIAKGLATAESSKLFGWKTLLTESGAKTLLQKAAELAPPSVPTLTVPSGAIQGGEEKVRGAVMELLEREYLYKDRLGSGAATDGTVDGLVDALHDPYTQYLPKVENENFQTQIRGSLEGIGANVEQTGGILRIVTPLKGSPAEKAGLLPRDQILSADGVTLSGLSIDEAVSKIRGPKGSQVLLRIRREGSELDVRVTRDTIRIPEVEVSMQGNIAVVKLYQFGDITEETLRGEMEKIAAQRPSGIVLDLRNNPGGLLDTAGTTVSNFLPLGSPFVVIHSRASTDTEYTRETPTISMDIPMVVLVNGGSASAAEIVAGALQDAKRATVIGQKTYGKGTVQQVVQFTDGSSLKLTVAEWKTPLERKIDGVGIIPDIVVENTSRTVDTQMDRAIQRLRS